MSTPTTIDVQNAFSVSGSEFTTQYARFFNLPLSDVTLKVINSSTEFHIKTYPTGSAEITFLTDTFLPINSTSPIIIPPTSSINIRARINTSTFDTIATSEIEFPYKFVISAMQYAVVTDTTVDEEQGDTTVCTDEAIYCNDSSDCPAGCSQCVEGLCVAENSND